MNAQTAQAKGAAVSEDAGRAPSIHEAEHYAEMAEAFCKAVLDKQNESPATAKLMMDAALVCAQLANAAATLQAAGVHPQVNPIGPDQLHLLGRIADQLEEMVGLLGRR